MGWLPLKRIEASSWSSWQVIVKHGMIAFEQLQIANRKAIEPDKFIGSDSRDGANMIELIVLGLFEVMENSPGGCDGHI